MHDRERAHDAGAAECLLGERAVGAVRAGVAAVEEQRPALGALVGFQVRLAAVEDQVVDDRDLVSHECSASPGVCYGPQTLPGGPGCDHLRGVGGRRVEVGGPGLVHLGVAAAETDQLVVGPELQDPPVVDHRDAVGAHRGRQPVGDDDRGPPLEDGVEAGLDLGLRLEVEVRRGLVDPMRAVETL